MIKWSDIEAECTGYKHGFVDIFRKYEGMDTDERDSANRVITVNVSTFCDRFGIARTTFRRWMEKVEGMPAGPATTSNTNVVIRIAEATAKATAEAEDKAAQALANQALAHAAQAKAAAEKAEKDKQAALAKAAREQAAAVEAERKRAKVEAEEAAKLKLQEIEARLRAEIKAEPPTPEILAEMAKQALTSSDPDIVNKMAEAYGKHRVEQDAKNKADAQARAAANRAAQAERDATNAEKRASQEYEDSALKLFMDAHEKLVDCAVLLGRKPITFSNLIASGLTHGEILDTVEEAIEISKRIEASIIEVTVTGDPVDVR